MKQEWIECTYDLVDEIKEQPTFKRLMELQQQLDENEQLQQLITAFQKTNIKYEEVRKYGKYHPDLKDVQKQFQQAKSNLYSHPLIVEYKQLEQQIQKQLDTISKTIATSISNKIKYPNEIGLINKH